MLRIVLIRPGSTDFDEQGRIKGTLDIPLSENGAYQVAQIVEELRETPIDYLYSSPCKVAQQTASAVALPRRMRVRSLDELQNIDHGLWHGKRVDEVRQSQPKVYRQLLEHPETVCPPQGEPVGDAMVRIRTVLTRLIRKHRSGVVGLIVPEPCASLVRSVLKHCDLGDLWKAECEAGGWQLIEVRPEGLAAAN